MRIKIEEKPGATTAWSEVNHLLAADERFAMSSSNWKGYLFAPKSVARLSALLFLLAEKEIKFSIRGLGSNGTFFESSIILSTRALTHVQTLQDGVVEVESGCDLKTLQLKLLENKAELNLHDWVWKTNKCSVGSAVIRGSHSGLFLFGQSPKEKLLSVEVAKLDGGILHWGRPLEAAKAGPALHKLLWGIGDMQGIIVKSCFKIHSIPAQRLFLSWSFSGCADLWKHVQDLSEFTHSWERLDVILSGNSIEKGLVLAQISGSEEEMNFFKNKCPQFQQAVLKDMIPSITQYFAQKNCQFYSVDLKNQLDQFSASDYLWYHVLLDVCWLATQQIINFSDGEKQKIEWKEHLEQCLK